MDILEKVKLFKKGRKIVRDLTIRARSGDQDAAFELMSEMTKDAIDEKEIIEELVKEVESLKKLIQEK
jgi:hypothetical protein